MISAFYCTKIFLRQSFQKRMNSFFKFWIKKTDSKIFLLIPIGYTLFLQILTGFPKPDSLNDIDANKLFIRFSEELFSYPFWLLDLSHLPLFFGFGWFFLYCRNDILSLGVALFPPCNLAFFCPWWSVFSFLYGGISFVLDEDVVTYSWRVICPHDSFDCWLFPHRA